MDGLGFRSSQLVGELERIRFVVEWFPYCWLKCVHGCGLFNTCICRVSLHGHGEQLTMQVCRPCLERMSVDCVFAKEVAACL